MLNNKSEAASLNNKLKEITDWKGNILKEGDEFCFVKIKTGNSFKNFGMLVHNINGTFKIHTIPNEPDEDCWEVGPYTKVKKDETGLFYTITDGEYTVHQPISMLNFRGSKNHILAIKGVSDMKVDKTDS